MNYKRIYDEFIADRRLKEKMAMTGYFERHHIIPKSMGGLDDASNLISLTAEDHVHAHLILAKAYGGSQWYSVNCLIYKRRKCLNIIPNRRMIRAAAIALEYKKYGRKDSQETKEKKSLARKKLLSNPEYKARTIEALKLAMATPEYRAAAKLRAKDIQNRPEVAAKRNAAVKASRALPAFRELMKITTTASWNVEGERDRRGKAISIAQKASGKLRLVSNTPEGKAHKVNAANIRWAKVRQQQLMDILQ